MAAEPRRHQILKAAKKLFFHYGPSKTTIHDIAREAQCAVGSVYLDFPSKEAILEELSTAEYQGVLEAMRDAMNDKPRARKSAKEHDAFEARFTLVLMRRTRAFFEVAREGAHTSELFHCRIGCVRSARSRFDELETQLLAAMFDAACKDGDCAKSDFTQTARAVQRCLVSVSPPKIFELDDAAAERATKDIAELLLRGLRAR
jgi:AcrR family transcriptional regulator